MKAGPRTRKVVAIKFDDGTERRIRDKQDIDDANGEARLAAAFPNLDVLGRRYWMAFIEATRQLRSKNTSEALRKNASKPRNKFAKDANAKRKLLEFKGQFEKANATTHGWKQSACAKFLIDPTTLKRILSRT